MSDEDAVSEGIEIDRWDVELWSARSRCREVCGILGCPNRPVLRCAHCENWYCFEHKAVLSTPGHRRKDG